MVTTGFQKTESLRFFKKPTVLSRQNIQQFRLFPPHIQPCLDRKSWALNKTRTQQRLFSFRQFTHFQLHIKSSSQHTWLGVLPATAGDFPQPALQINKLQNKSKSFLFQKAGYLHHEVFQRASFSFPASAICRGAINKPSESFFVVFKFCVVFSLYL